MPMNPEVKAKWLEALRSGEYEQGVCSLRHDNTFCAFGVLCDISKIGRWDNNLYVAQNWKENCKISPPIRQWAGFDTRLDDAGYPINSSVECLIVSMNDLEGKTFPEIADWIEVNL